VKSEFFVKLAIYMVFGFGVLLFFYDEINLAVTRFRLRHRLKALRTEKKELPKALEALYRLIDSSFERASSKTMFIIFEALLFINSYFLSYKNFNPFTALVVSFISLSMPILFLAQRLSSNRSKASREGISLVSELYRQYRINKLNIYEAIEKTVSAEGDYRISSKALSNLLIRIRASSSPIDVYEAIDKFVFSFGTGWAKMLGQCIRLSVDSGSDISAGLEDIVLQLKEANSLEEKRKMLNGEASRMTLLVVPFMYLICMLTSVSYLKLDLKTLLSNQFLNPTGFLLFFLSIFLFLINLLLLNLVSNTKLDY